MSRHRLTVVLSQAQGKNPAKRALEESIAAVQGRKSSRGGARKHAAPKSQAAPRKPSRAKSKPAG